MHYLKVLQAAGLVLLTLLAGCATSPEQPVETRVTSGIVESRDDVPIVYEGFGQGEITVMFIHCWACNRNFWLNQVDPVVEAGYRVVTLDLPGHGQSGADREEWSLTGLAIDVAEVIDALDLTRVILVGHGIGARISLDVSSLMSDHVIGIGCVDALRNAEFPWPDAAFEGLATAMRRDFQRGIESMVLPALHRGFDLELAQWIIEQSVESDHSATIELLTDFPRADVPTQFLDAGVPIRCINAAARGGRPAPTEIEINRKYADFDAILMEEVGHYPQLENPEAFNKHLLDLLGELNRRTQ